MSRRRSSRYSTVVATIVALSTALLQSQLPAQTVVVRRNDIERAGWNRVTEILDGAVGWGPTSVDAFSFAASPDRLPPAGESGPSMPEWIVTVDGQRVPTDMFGLHLLELLPISAGQIDSVVFTPGPTIYAGVPVTRGVMSIFSRSTRPGLNAELTYQHGDESGDPGPYRYTNLSSPNVEKIGPFIHADIGWRGSTWDIDAGVHAASLNITDTLISSRFSPTTFAGVQPDVIAITPTFRAGVEGLGGRHEVMASYGEQRGLLFISPQRIEQSLRTTDSYIGVAGSLTAIASTAVTYEGSSTTIDASELASPLAFSVGHTRRHVGGTVSATHSVGRAMLTIGAVGDRWTLAINSVAESATSSGGGPLMHVRVPMGDAVTLTGSTTLIFDGAQRSAFDATADATFRLDSLSSLTFRASRVNAHPNMDGSWIDAFVLGYPLSARAPTVSGLGLTLARRFVPHVGVTIEVRGEKVASWSGLSHPSLSEGPSAADSFFHDATLVGGHVRVETLGGGVWQGSIEYDRSATLKLDDAAFESEIRSTPSDDLRGQLSAGPVRDFRVSGIVNLSGGTRWSAFGDASVPPARRVDASMEKWMWRRRLRLELLYRNLLNEPERHHPFGAQWNLRWHASASLVF